jgi:molybdopterin molybdotransferase
MDGYAVRADERGPWRVVGESAAGHPFAGPLGPGEAVRISTGALMPEGADAVLLQENAGREGETLALNGEGPPSSQHIRRAGFDFRAGETLLDAGTRVGPAQIALALAGGHAALTVHRRARLAVVDSGDELVADPAACAPHQLPMSNGAMVAALARPLAESVRHAGPVPDRLDALREAFASLAEADLIVTSGGASVGDHDLLRPALEAWGAQIGFWRVAMKPGKPLLIARKGSQLVLGLPGNPVSSFVTAYLFVLPLLRRLAGALQCLPRPLEAALTAPLPAGGARTEFVRGRLDGGGVTPLDEQDSSALRSLAGANVLIERPVGAPSAAAGEAVPVYLLDNGGIA